MIRIKFTPIFFLVIFLISCQNKNNSSNQVTNSSDIKLYIFDVGEILIKDVSIFSSDETGAKLLTNCSYLIRHPKGDLIWDTGFPDSLVALQDGLDSEAATISMKKTLAGQLQEIGMGPGDIEFLALSHLHPDHSGNSNLFTSATLLLQQEEYDSLFKNPIDPNVKELRENPVTKLDGDFDVFGDRRVIIKRAPGHTNGHQILFIDLPETGPIVLSGDLFITTEQRKAKGVPVFNTDKELTLLTITEVENFISEKKATLWIQHDLEENLSRKRSPAFYK